MIDGYVFLGGGGNIVIFFSIYVAAQFIGGGKLLHALFGIDEGLAILLTALIVIPYTAYGGFQSVVYTDCMQAVLMFTSFAIAPIFGIIYIANTPGVFATSLTKALINSGSSYTSFLGGFKGFAAGAMIGAGLSWIFGYLGGIPQLNARYMAMRNKSEMIKARRIAIPYLLLTCIGATAIAFLGIAIFGPNSLEDVESVMPLVMLKVFPTALATLFITGAVAAMLSTADSILVLAGTEASINIIKPFFLKKSGKFSEKQGLKISRLTTIILSFIGLGIAYFIPTKVIYNIVGYVWAGLGNPFAVITILTFFWKKFTGKAVIYTIIVGLCFNIFWIVSGLTRIVDVKLIGFIITLTVAIIVSYLTQPKKVEGV